MVFIVRLLAMCANGLRYLKGAAGWAVGLNGFGGIAACAVSMAFFGVMVALIGKMLDTLGGVKTSASALLSGMGSADSSFLGKVNYFLPLDTLATVFILYTSVWVAVQTFKFWVKWTGVASAAMEKVKGQ